MKLHLNRPVAYFWAESTWGQNEHSALYVHSAPRCHVRSARRWVSQTFAKSIHYNLNNLNKAVLELKWMS